MVIGMRPGNQASLVPLLRSGKCLHGLAYSQLPRRAATTTEDALAIQILAGWIAFEPSKPVLRPFLRVPIPIVALRSLRPRIPYRTSNHLFLQLRIPYRTSNHLFLQLRMMPKTHRLPPPMTPLPPPFQAPPWFSIHDNTITMSLLTLSCP
jgi:hypothetical protein